MNSKQKEFTKICSLKDLSENKGKRFIIEENEIAIFLVAGEVFALSNHCPHQHSAMIYDGFLADGCVVCPAHGWMFNLKTGKTPEGGNGLESYETMVMGKDVYIDFRKKEWNW
jgi:nitrite reductase/ring-hydroxylating ferredoxin subunit